MAFTGKATFSAGAGLPEIAEDVSDIIGLVSPFETPLLDHLGDPRREARSTVHEWLEDELAPNFDRVDQTDFVPNPVLATAITVDNGDRFRVGDQVRPDGTNEIMLVTAVSGNELTVVRGYGGTVKETLTNNKILFIVSNAALEGAEKPGNRFTTRSRRQNYTQIFGSAVEVSGSQLAVDTIGVADELEYQKQERLRELLRDLENSVINGVAAESNPQGNSTTRRTMNGVLAMLTTNVFSPGVGPIPSGDGVGSDELNEAVLNAALKEIWDVSSGHVDTIVVGGQQKRRINGFVSQLRGYQPSDTTFSDMVSVYESDFGVCRVVMSRWVPSEKAILLDSSRASVLPLSGRAFHFKKLASDGDSECGMALGEYTFELMNEAAHGVIEGLAA